MIMGLRLELVLKNTAFAVPAVAAAGVARVTATSAILFGKSFVTIASCVIYCAFLISTEIGFSPIAPTPVTPSTYILAFGMYEPVESL